MLPAAPTKPPTVVPSKPSQISSAAVGVLSSIVARPEPEPWSNANVPMSPMSIDNLADDIPANWSFDACM